MHNWHIRTATQALCAHHVGSATNQQAHCPEWSQVFQSVGGASTIAIAMIALLVRDSLPAVPLAIAVALSLTWINIGGVRGDQFVGRGITPIMAVTVTVTMDVTSWTRH